MISESPNLSGVISAHVRAGLADTFVAQPARIVSYDEDTQRATVDLMVRDFAVDRSVPSVTYATEPTRISDVPILGLGSSQMGWFWISPSENDTVMVFFADRSLDEVKAGAGDNSTDGVQVADVGALHDLTNAFAILIPNLSRAGATSLSAFAGATTGPTIVPGTGKFINLGSKNPSEFAAMAARTNTHLETLRTAMVTIATAAGVPVPPTIASAFSSVACSKVKVT